MLLYLYTLLTQTSQRPPRTRPPPQLCPPPGAAGGAARGGAARIDLNGGKYPPAASQASKQIPSSSRLLCSISFTWRIMAPALSFFFSPGSENLCG